MKNTQIINQIEIKITQIQEFINNWKLEISKYEEIVLNLTQQLQEIKNKNN